MDYLSINKKLWDNKTEVHVKSEFYDVEGFINGSDSLNSIELSLLGNIKGKSVLHLQCHFGQDTISLSRHGAKATGIDLSEKAILQGQELSRQLKTDTRFIQSDVYSLKDVLQEKFDIVFTSYGVIGWLPDMKKWAETIHHFLKPGGELIFVEFHPVIWMMSYDFQRIEFKYNDSEPIIEELEGTYTDRDAKSKLKDKSICWNHGLSTVLDALIKAGLVINDFREYDYSPYNCFENTVQIEKRKFQIKSLEGMIPMVYSVKATKPT